MSISIGSKENSPIQISQTRQGVVSFRKIQRIGLFCLSLSLFALLLVAAWLKPDPAGLGTHTQLGLPGCTMHSIVGMRCPGCGMTTSWAHTMNGNLSSAISANVGGVLLCFLTISAIPCFLWMAIRGKSLSGSWHASVATTILVIAVSIAIAEWMFRGCRRFLSLEWRCR